MKTHPDQIAVGGYQADGESTMEVSIANPITLKCRLPLPNRLAKAAMAENFADKDHLPSSEQCLATYRHWAQGGWGMAVTGNVQIDSTYLGPIAYSVK